MNVIEAISRIFKVLFLPFSSLSVSFYSHAPTVTLTAYIVILHISHGHATESDFYLIFPD